MADSTLFDLSAFPPPQVIEEISHQAIVDAMKADVVARCAAAGLDISGIINLESEPLHYEIQSNGYREVLTRARINDATQANLLAFGTAADLDHLAVFYDVIRMAGETDERLRRRVILAIQGRSTGGTAPRYRAVALAASLRVADAEVYRIGTDPVVHVAVYAADNGGVADTALLDEVRFALNAADVRMVNDTIEVRSAVFVVQNIECDIWLLPETPDTLITRPSSVEESPLAKGLREAWAAETGLGFDLARSWITARLMRPGIQKVEPLSPTTDVVAPPYQAVSIGTITFNNKGRAY